MRYTLRYTKDAPIQPRPHAPTVPMFGTLCEAIDHLDEQPNKDVLEVVKR
jgi:hypothetical protein